MDRVANARPVERGFPGTPWSRPWRLRARHPCLARSV